MDYLKQILKLFVIFVFMVSVIHAITWGSYIRKDKILDKFQDRWSRYCNEKENIEKPVYMSTEAVVPPRISNTPPPIDSSFDESSNNSKSADDINLNLDDSCNNNNNNDESVSANVSLPIMDDDNIRPPSPLPPSSPSSLTKAVHINDEIALETKDRSLTITNDDLSNESSTTDHDVNVTPTDNQCETKSIVMTASPSNEDFNKKEEDECNLTDDKLNNIIQNFHIDDFFNSDNTNENQEEQTNLKQQLNLFDNEWNPFGDDGGNTMANNNDVNNQNQDDWANFGSNNETNQQLVDENLDFFNEINDKSKEINIKTSLDDFFSGGLDEKSEVKMENVDETSNKMAKIESDIGATVNDDDDDWDNFVSVDTQENILETIPSDLEVNLNSVKAQVEEPVSVAAASILTTEVENDAYLESKKELEEYWRNLDDEIDRLFEKLVPKGSIEEELSAEDIDYNDEKNNVFLSAEFNDQIRKLCDYKNSEFLKFNWRTSKLEELYVESLGIDKKKVNKSTPSSTFSKNRYTTVFSSNMDTILQPTKVEATQVTPTPASNVVESVKTTSIAPEMSIQEPVIKENLSNLNTTDISKQEEAKQVDVCLNLDLDLSYLEEKTSSKTSETSNNNNSNTTSMLLNELLNDIYPSRNDTKTSVESQSTSIIPPILPPPPPPASSAKSKANATATTNSGLILTPQFDTFKTSQSSSINTSQSQPQQQQIQQQQHYTQLTQIIKTNNDAKLSNKAIDLLNKLPNLSFMKSKVLVFPVHATVQNKLLVNETIITNEMNNTAIKTDSNVIVKQE